MMTVVDHLNFPTSLAFDGEGSLYVAESGLPLDGLAPGGRVWRIAPGGARTCLIEGLRPPVTGLVYHEGGFYLSEGGNPGRISRLSSGGIRTTILDGLPGFGNYHTNTVAVGPDGKLYFGQGALTNSGVLGLDSLELAWLGRLPHDPDVPGYPIRLTGWHAEIADANGWCPTSPARTSAFSPFGHRVPAGHTMPPAVPCTASVMRCNPDGSGLELVAWGIRNAFGLGFLGDGRLLATDQGPDERGSRPIAGAPDLLWEIKPGRWYGWPDFVGGVPVTDPRFVPSNGVAQQFVVANHDELPLPEQPLLAFPVNASATKFDVVPEGAAGRHGHLLVALFGDEKPMTAGAGARAGRALAWVNPQDWCCEIFAEGQFARPIDVRFAPGSGELYVLDFGEFEMGPAGQVFARAGSGKVATISIREEQSLWP